MIVYRAIDKAHNTHQPIVIARRKAPWQSQKTALYQEIPTPGSVAVPDIFLGDKAPSSAIDRGHSLRSLYPPQAALPSLPLARNDNKAIPYWRIIVVSKINSHLLY